MEVPAHETLHNPGFSLMRAWPVFVVIQKGLESRVEIIRAQTRLTDSPYYKINPSGRVPYLIRDVTAPAWRNPLSSAPISIELTVSQSSICRPVTNNGRPVVSKGYREACWMDSQCGAARSRLKRAITDSDPA